MADARDLIRQFLASWGLSNMEGFIESAMTEGWDIGGDEFMLRLRDTPEYAQAFPEAAYREANGYRFMPEAQILAMRDEVNRLTREYLGLNLAPDQVSRIIGRDKSLSEWENQLKDWKLFEQWGPTVKFVLEQELGREITDDRAFALLSSEIQTPELDRAYEMALRRGQPAALGLGVRPEAEAELLRQHGIDPTAAFRAYQGIASELPRAERLAFIEAEINRNQQSFPSPSELFADTPYATLFRAIQLGDPEALLSIQQTVARETARFQGQGGAQQGRGGQSIGLLDAEERERA
jgi:hypothetical protein